ncbi:MAG: putative Zn-dependent protease [Granulosicoccus sp.]
MWCQQTRLATACLRILLGVSLALAFSTVYGQQNLPNMGEPADSALSPVEEQQLGAQFMRQIRAQLPLIKDVQLNEYIHNLGNRLVLASGKSESQDFTFFIIDDPQINAFAIPGGYVGINSGLVAAMPFEEHLASVVAHEVAHVTQRHHARAFATGNRATLSTAAAVLAAIIIGQASPQAGQAALAAGLAASQQSAINFTRSNEVEADRIGIEILENAQYDPRAMAETFSILRRKNSLNTSAGQLEYLRTHPLDNNRIAEATDRAASKPVTARVRLHDYSLFRARLGIISSNDTGQLKRVYLANHDKSPTVESAYALALISQRANLSGQANQYLAQLDELVSTHPMIELLRADIASMDNKKTDDVLLEVLSELYPDRYSIVEKRLDQLIRDRRLIEASNAVKNYLRGSKRPNPLAWRQLADIQERLEDKADSHESLAKYFEALDELDRAASQLELALMQVSPSSQDKLRLDARLRDLREKATRSK